MAQAKKFNNGETLGSVREILNSNADAVNERVEKETGKGLSSNDFTNTHLNKVNAALTEHQDISGLQPKVTGKGLSTNDYTTTEQTKLNGIATQATKNDTDANLKNRANHTGSQAINTITGLQAALDARTPIDPASPIKPTLIWKGSQAQYDAITTKVATTEYQIFG